MIVVSDAGPLHYLVLIGEAAVLLDLYGGVIIPGAVHAELTRPQTPEQVRQWLQAPPAWLNRHEVGEMDQFPTLDRGEREAIALSLSVGADLILLDEKKGRAVARAQGLRVVGTLGVLAQAAAQNLLVLPNALERLRQTTFQVSEALCETVLEHDRQRQAKAGRKQDA